MFMERYVLTEEQKKADYAKYFYEEPAPFDQEKMAKMQDPIDPSKATPLDRINDLLKPGYLETEIGWCVMDDGSGFIANHNIFKDVTLDMMKWWFAWHAVKDLRYKIWFPPGHFHISVPEESRKKILDPSLSYEEKIYGMTHHVVEACDGPTEDIYISFMSPEDMGFDMSKFDPKTMAFFGGNGVSRMINPPPGVPRMKSPAAMCHFCRVVDGGIEMRTRFWMGKKMIDKKPVHCLPQQVRLPPFVPANLARHNVMEYANLARLLPRIYKEQGGKILDN